MSTSNILAQKKTIKRNWLIAYVLSTIASFLTIPSEMYDFVFKNKDPFFQTLNTPQQQTFYFVFLFGFIILIGIIFHIILFMFFYHCSYTKSGTKLLLSYLIFMGICTTLALIHFVTITTSGFLTFVYLVPFRIYFYVMSYHLYKLNKAKNEHAIAQ